MIQNKIKNYIKETVLDGVNKSKEAMAHGVLIGLIVGFVIAFVDYLINDLLLSRVSRIPTIYQSLLPFAGFILIGLVSSVGKIKNSSMADEIVRVYHHGDEELNLRYVLNKFLAFVLTMVFGLTAGLEGACKWLGGVIGVFYFRLFPKNKYLESNRPELITSMMSGASAGISAIFKAPLSGTIMALESPFKKDFAHKPLVQSFISAVTSYTVYVAFRGSEKFFLVDVKYALRHDDIFYAVILGLSSGIISTILIRATRRIKNSVTEKYFLKYIIGGALLTLLAVMYFEIHKTQDILFSGMPLINSVFASKVSLGLILIIFAFRFFAYIFTFSFGGVGGQFLPSAALGAVIGYLIQFYFGLHLPHVFTLLGISSFITASYNGLLFGPVLIAEITGQPSLVVLGIVSSCISFLVTNGVSNSSYQKHTRDE